MLYEVEVENSYDFPELFEKVKELGNFCVSGNKLYIETDVPMSNIFDIIKVSGIKKIDSRNYLSLCSPIVQKWCATSLSKKLINEFEESERGQQAIITFTNLLKKAMENREEGGAIVGGKEKTTES